MVFSWKESIKKAECKCKANLQIAQKNGDQDRIRILKRRLERYAKHA